ncbi:unnamed protein product [Pleuronectes platessa]|uniref:Uncharacterized protein n=1 Tax=Pleuronectes platessa TaxID=8262 RepID=A0A9N7URU4_PLEPL|nr:unnamed protein product [Pleuronectes platessa]
MHLKPQASKWTQRQRHGPLIGTHLSGRRGTSPHRHVPGTNTGTSMEQTPTHPRSKHRPVHQKRAADMEPAARGHHPASPSSLTGTPRAEEGAVARNLPRPPALLLGKTSASHPTPLLVGVTSRLASQLTPAATS